MKKINLLFVLTLTFTTITLSAQSDSLEVWKYKHMVSPDEMTRSLDTRAFIETDPPLSPARSIAEFEPQAAVLIRYQFGIPINFIAKLAEKDTVITIVSSYYENTVRNQYTNAGIDLSKCKFYNAPTDSYWTRDYGPMFTMDGNDNIGCVDFIYNRPRPNDDNIARTIATFLNMPFYGMRVVHTGGNYMSDGYGVAASTNIVYSESMSEGITNAQVNQRMLAYLGIDRHYVLQDPNNTYIDHIDCWGKFLAVDKILIRSVPRSHPRYNALEAMADYWADQTSSWGNKYKVYRVNTPSNEPYTNSLILNKRVFVPQMNNGNDAAALTVYQNAMPGYEIIGVYGVYSYPWENTDALHCRTHEIADKGYLYISHYPDFEPHEYNCTYSLSAKIKALSGRGFYNDSLRIYYRFDDGDWNYSLLSSQENNMFVGDIFVPNTALKVDYYFHAADSSGRSQHYPIVGEYDPFTFEIIYGEPMLSLSETEFEFDEPDIKILTISNLTSYTATIESVNNEFLNYSDIIPQSESEVFDYPLCLAPDENISFKIIPLAWGKNGFRDIDYNIDTLKIVTPDSVYCVVIKCNKSLLEEHKSELTFSETEFIFDYHGYEILTVSNLTDYAATIEFINSDSLQYSMVRPYPYSEIFEYPLIIAPLENITYKIVTLAVVKKELRYDYYYIDTLKIITPDSTYNIVIKINSDLMSVINELENETIVIYPSPFDETLNIICGIEKALSCTIFDNSGRVITKLYPAENNSFIWSSVNVSKGMYFVQISTDKGVITKKVVKK